MDIGEARERVVDSVVRHLDLLALSPDGDIATAAAELRQSFLKAVRDDVENGSSRSQTPLAPH